MQHKKITFHDFIYSISLAKMYYQNSQNQETNISGSNVEQETVPVYELMVF